MKYRKRLKLNIIAIAFLTYISNIQYLICKNRNKGFKT